MKRKRVGEDILSILMENDPKLIPIVEKYGKCKLLEISSTTSAFEALCISIISQQLSQKAADTIRCRFMALIISVEPENALKHSVENLKSCGLSARKATYIHNLAIAFKTQDITDSKLQNLNYSELSGLLTQIKGIGQWTVDMFCMFQMKRLDILPLGDLGFRKGFEKFIGRKQSPSQIKQYCKKWEPYQSIASWYMWCIKDDTGK